MGGCALAPGWQRFRDRSPAVFFDYPQGRSVVVRLTPLCAPALDNGSITAMLSVARQLALLEVVFGGARPTEQDSVILDG